MRRSSSTLFATLSAAVLLAAGCSFLVDVSLQPCAEDEPCPGEEICKEGVCVGSECTDHQACMEQDTESAKFACQNGQCTTVECAEDAECTALGKGFENSICSDNGVCGPPDCQDNAECRMKLDTDDAVCQAGRCVDPIWGCIGRADPREEKGDRASFKVLVQDALNEEALESLSVETCRKFDPNCDNALRVSASYDNKTGELTVEGLEQGFNGFFRLVGTKGEQNFLEARFNFSTRPVINDDSAAEPVLMINSGLISTVSGAAGVEVDPALGTILARVYNCQGEPAAGVTMVSGDPGLNDDAEFFYLDSGNLPNQDLSETDSAGRAGLANILKTGENVDSNITLEAFTGGRMITQFTLNIVPNAITYVYIYPGYE